MRRWDFDDASSGFDLRFELAAAELGLTARRFVLKSIPQSVHWHLGKPGSKGTLEATWLQETQTAWLAARANRNAGWIDQAVAELLARLVRSP